MPDGAHAEAILAHPRYAEARLAHLNALAALFRGDPFARRLMSDAGFIMLRGMLVGAHTAFTVEDRATWPTPGALKLALVEWGLTSPRRVDHMIAEFRQAGYVDVMPAPDDRRISLLVPTASLLAHDRAHLAAYHRFLLELFPGRGYEWVLGPDEAAYRAIRVGTWRDLPRGTSALTHAAIRLFLARDAGYLALLLVLRAELSGQAGLTWSSLSDELGVARSHLRSLFGEAEGLGYVRLRAGRGGPVEVLPPLWAAYDWFLAEVAADQNTIAQAVFAGTCRGAGPVIR